MQKLTPVLFVESVEEAERFWTDRLGFIRTIGVPLDGPDGSGPMGFVALERGEVEIMLQSRASIAGDLPSLGAGAFECTGVSLFIEVGPGEIFDAIRDAIPSEHLFLEERVTFYGMREVGARVPLGGGATIACVFATRDLGKRITPPPPAG